MVVDEIVLHVHKAKLKVLLEIRPFHTGSANRLFDVDTNYCRTLSTAEVHCAFPSGQFISDHCTVEYWTASSPHIIQTSNRQDNDQVLVLLLEGLQPETLYNYTVSASNGTLQLKVKVEGVFITGEIGNIVPGSLVLLFELTYYLLKLLLDMQVLLAFF